MYLSKRLGSRSEKMAMGIFNPNNPGGRLRNRDPFVAALRDPKNDESFFSGCRFDHNKSSKPLGSANSRRNVIPKMGIAA